MKQIQKALCLVAGLAMMVAPMAFADTGWTGNTDTQVNVAGNWNNGLPTGGSVGTVTDADVTYSSHNGIELAGYQVVFDGASTFTNAAAGKSSFILQDGAVFTYNDTTSGFLGDDTTSDHRHLSIRDGGTFHWNSTGTLNGINEIILSASNAVMSQSAGLLVADVGFNVDSGSYTLSGGTVVGNGAYGLKIATGTLDFLTTGTTGIVQVAAGKTSVFEGFITNGLITIDGAVATLADFVILDGNWTQLSLAGMVLIDPNAPPTDTIFLGGELNTAANWDEGFPGLMTGWVGVDGLVNNNDVSSWGTSTVNHTNGTISSSGTTGFNLYGNLDLTWNQSGGAIDIAADRSHYANKLTYNLSGGTSTSGKIEAENGGTFTQTGGTVTSIGPVIYQANASSVVNLSGGTGTSTTAANALSLAGGTISVDGDFAMEFTQALLTGTSALTFSTNWTGSFVRDNYTEADWQAQLVDGLVYVEETIVSDENFSIMFSVANAGAAGSALTVTGVVTDPLPPVTESIFLGGNLDNAAHWSEGFPVNIVGTVNSNGILQGNFPVGSWGTFVVNHTAGTLSPSPGGFNLYGNANGIWNQNGGAINAPANRSLFANALTHNLISGTATAGWVQATGGGTFTQTGGSVTAIGTDGGGKIYAVSSGGIINLLGGTGASSANAAVALDLADGTINVGGDFSMEFPVDLISPNGAGTLDFSTDWFGSFVCDYYTAAQWQTQLVDAVSGRVSVDGTAVTDANFSTLFVVENAGAVGSSLSILTSLVPIGDITLTNSIAGGMSITWDSVIRQPYELQETTDLIYEAWGTYTNVIGTGGEISISIPEDQPKAFYRVISE